MSISGRLELRLSKKIVKTLSYINPANSSFQSLPLEKVDTNEISLALSSQIEEVVKDGKKKTYTLDVEFELDEERILRLRESGKAWDREEPWLALVLGDGSRQVEKSKEVDSSLFHNPYNFVPAVPRKKNGKELIKCFSESDTGRELGDRPPVGHGRYYPGYWSGRLAIKLETVTPLLIPDASRMEEVNEHKIYPMREDANGKPLLPPTSIKGMLRSAYEAITNSRLSILDPHNERLAYRKNARTGIQMVPARINGGRVCLCPGTSEIRADGSAEGGMYAAWLPRYSRQNGQLQNEVRYPDNKLPEHGDRVWFRAQKTHKTKGSKGFEYWKVLEIAKKEVDLSSDSTSQEGARSHQTAGREIKIFSGHVCITNKNFDRKHDERVFIENDRIIELPLSDELKSKWRELINNYQKEHKDEIRQGVDGPQASRDNVSKWSRHVTGGGEECELREGTLCYAQVKKSDGRVQILGLYPVMISRGLYESSPIELLDESLKPASSWEKLSPADRVFGWVKKKGKGAYKGQLRVHSVTCTSEDAIEPFEETVPLAILGQPKPQQARFYCASTPDGEPLEGALTKDKGYQQGRGLRGRKVYPHHKGLPENYWKNPREDRTQSSDRGHYQEYRQPTTGDGAQYSNQNRSLKGWVKPGTSFEFDIDLINLSSVELGALLWLMSSSEVHYHRLGGGKPLGFGSVWLEIDWEKSDLRIGEDWQMYYRSLVDETSMKKADVLECIVAYIDAITSAYSHKSLASTEEKVRELYRISFISAFCRSTKGYDDNAAIHYPRLTESPSGKIFDWFVENENGWRERVLPKLADRNHSGPLSTNFEDS